MKSWKTLLGVGAACTVCCAAPLVGGATMLAAGSTGLAAAGAAMVAWMDHPAPALGALLSLAAIAGAWRVACAGR